MKDSEVLAAAAEVVTNGYAKDGYAVNEAGCRVDIMSPDATTFCLVGGVARVCGGSTRAADGIVDKWLLPLLPKRYLPIRSDAGYSIVQKAPAVREYNVSARAWNDERDVTKEQVVARLREASAIAAKAGE
jgi:hypothetical protein